MATTIEISDDDLTASSAGSNTPPASALRKRKPSLDFEEKVAWTDDDDDEDGGHVKSLTQKRPAKRRAAPKEKGKGKGKRPARKSTAPATKPAKKGAADLAFHVNSVAESSAPEEYAEALMPDFLLERRKKFDRDTELLKDAGLRLPPDYSDIYFSDDEHSATLEERPSFDNRSGIKPCRPYKDIELEYSAGIIPACIAQYLRDYQITGVKFLHQRFVYQRGCILGDDMGLGKTVQVAAFLCAAFGKTGDERDAKRMRKMRRAGEHHWYPRVLIVCPGSLIQNWKNELTRWGYWHVDTYHGPRKDDVLQAAKAGRLEIIITTYTTYKKMREAVNEVEWDCVVADECHALKDGRSETTQAMDEVNALCRIGLTGTAIQNKYEELWTLLNWTNPGRFGTLSEWSNTITKPLTVGQSHDATPRQLSICRTTAKKLVENLLPDFFLRRMKTLIAHQLPKKSDKVVFCPLTSIQIDAYENFLEGPHVTAIKTASELCDCDSGRKRGWCCYKMLEDGKSWMAVVFPTIMTLQKLSNHLTLLIPSSTDPTDKQTSELRALQTCVPDDWAKLYRNRDSMLNLANPEFCGKWKILKKLLKFWHENGDKVLVFSHSVRLLRILQHLFHNTSYNVSFLDGSLTYEDRQKVVDDFNSDPSQFVFLISTKAGGVGLNITSANKVVIFDPHWNPAYDLQAQDRAYRIGQVRDVDVFRLVSAGTIEEIVYARQIYKQQQANIGYNASNERRYFKGVQQDSTRQGEIFGLSNLLSYHPDQVVLREIVNKTNIAEAKAGVNLTDIDLDKLAKDENQELNFVKQEEGNDGDEGSGMGQLAKLLTAENQADLLRARKANKPEADAIAAILASAGVEYTHENSEVIGTSRVEAQLSRRAALAAVADADTDPEEEGALFADSQANVVSSSARALAKQGGQWRAHYVFNPPADVMRRQFCSMAREFGFASATDFALVVESWTQEQRRNCLDKFYRAREAAVLEETAAQGGVKSEGDRDGEGGSGDDPKSEEEGAVVKREGEDRFDERDMEGPVPKPEGVNWDGDLPVKKERIPSPVQVKNEEEPEEFMAVPVGPSPPPVPVKLENPSATIFLSDDDDDDEL